MASDDLDTLARLRGLLDVSRVVRDEESLPEVLNAIAGTIAEIHVENAQAVEYDQALFCVEAG